MTLDVPQVSYHADMYLLPHGVVWHVGRSRGQPTRLDYAGAPRRQDRVFARTSRSHRLHLARRHLMPRFVLHCRMGSRWPAR